jgi:uncharacterized BrkB/YihY/UPF0761 family membrane protein
MLESIFEIIAYFIFEVLLGGILRILSLVVLWLKNMGRKSVKEIWNDKEAMAFTGITFIVQIFVLILIIIYIVFIILSIISIIKMP